MKSQDTQKQRLRQALKATYAQREQAEFEVSGRWQMDVMRDIRRIGPLNAQGNLALFFEHFVWRFAATACAIVFMLSVYVGITGWNPVEYVAALYFSNPVEFTVAQALGEYESYE